MIAETRKPTSRSTYPTNTLQTVNQLFQAQSAVSSCKDHAALTILGRGAGRCPQDKVHSQTLTSSTLPDVLSFQQK